MELKQKIAKLETGFKNVLFELNQVNEDNLNKKINRLTFLHDKIKNEREQLLKEYPQDDLKNFNIIFDKYIKEITKSYDNMIEENKYKQELIKKELGASLNNRKLVNYQR